MAVMGMVASHMGPTSLIDSAQPRAVPWLSPTRPAAAATRAMAGSAKLIATTITAPPRRRTKRDGAQLAQPAVGAFVAQRRPGGQPGDDGGEAGDGDHPAARAGWWGVTVGGVEDQVDGREQPQPEDQDLAVAPLALGL